MDEIVESSSPLISSPEVMDEEATKPVDNALLQALKGGKPKTSMVIPPSSPSKPRGRPPKAREITPEESREIKNKIKREKTEQYTTMIVRDMNEQLMSLLIAMGVPPEMLYQKGMVPKSMVVDSAYTPIANGIAIKPNQAKSIAAFIAELEMTNTGQRLSNKTSSQNAALGYKGIMAVVATGSYLMGLNKTMKTIMPVVQAFKEAQKNKEKPPVQQPTEKREDIHGSGIQ